MDPAALLVRVELASRPILLHRDALRGHKAAARSSDRQSQGIIRAQCNNKRNQLNSVQEVPRVALTGSKQAVI